MREQMQKEWMNQYCRQEEEMTWHSRGTGVSIWQVSGLSHAGIIVWKKQTVLWKFTLHKCQLKVYFAKIRMKLLAFILGLCFSWNLMQNLAFRVVSQTFMKIYILLSLKNIFVTSCETSRNWTPKSWSRQHLKILLIFSTVATLLVRCVRPFCHFWKLDWASFSSTRGQSD